jgi:signal transduction histidine kinase
MSLPRPSHEDVVAAVGTAAWAAAFLVDTGTPGYVVPVLTGLGTLVGRSPLLGGALVAAAQAITAVALGPESPAVLMALLLTAYAVGRRASGAVGACALGLLAAALLVPTPTLGNTVFGGVLLASACVFGRLVRQRAVAAADAAAREVRLRATDPAALAARTAAAERSRLAGEAIAVVGDAIDDMRRLATRARQRLAPDGIEAIQQQGSEAVVELRRLLGLLRDTEPEEPTCGAAGEHRRLPAAAGTALLLGLAVVVEAVALPGRLPVTGLALTLALPLALLVRHLPALGCAIAAGAAATGLVAGIQPVRGIAELMVLGLLSWAVGRDSDLRSWEAWGLMAALTAGSVWHESPDDLAVTAAALVLPAFAGRAWGERDRAARAADDSAGDLQSHLDRAVATAVAEERLRIARELHDVTSHAVGVMVLQAGAAAALRDRDPAAARSALDVVASSGERARAELGLLADVLTGSPAETWPVPGGDLRAALTDLVARLRAAGLRVDLQVAALPEDVAVRATVYRVVQEALTNATRHAPAARVTVSVRQEGDDVVVEVVDDGDGEAAVVGAAGSGFGLIGLAERVRASGGRLSSGPRPGRGFEVRARLPRAPMVAQ